MKGNYAWLEKSRGKRANGQVESSSEDSMG